MIGQTLSHYRITAALGAGGMGEVYRATDTTLGRDVALKILPPEVAKDPERLERFQREAHLLAALNHPNIAAIHGLEGVDRQPFLVLELVEGEDLRTRLARGAVPVDEALEIAEQVAEALEEAHSKGIVHRDLKPANVMLTSDGKVKVLDFGLAKAWAGDTPEGGSPSGALSQSPTLAHTGTVAGVVLGTAAYMSPEQARGKPVDKRADVWSFGVLLWEMLTGQALFAGDTVTDVIAAVVTKEADLDAIPVGTPRAVHRLLSRCLRKEPRKRLPDMGAARLELEDVRAGTADAPVPPEAGDGVVAAERRRVRLLRWALAAAGVVIAGMAVALAVTHLTKASVPPGAVHFMAEAPEGFRLADFGDLPVPSPDGRHVAFTGFLEGNRQLWIRTLDAPEARPLPATEGARFAFWSPDSAWIAFFTTTDLNKVRLAAGGVQRVCALPRGTPVGGTWGDDGTIVFSAGGASATLFAVAAAGGEARPLTALDESRGELGHWWPQFLPGGGGHFIFAVGSSQDQSDGLHLASLDAPEDRRLVLPGSSRVTYASGHLLFVRDATLFAQPFDPRAVQVSGEPVPVAQGVASFRSRADWGWFSASPSGVLAYREGGASAVQLAWVDRKGGRLETVGEPGPYGQIALSPDERRVALEMPGDEGLDLWVMDVARGVASRVTTDPADEGNPVWSPDGRELVYQKNATGGIDLFRKGLGRGASAEPLLESPGNDFPEDWSRDGRTLFYIIGAADGQAVWALPLADDGPPELVLKTGFRVAEPRLSPDGRWLAYISDESGRFEVYVEPFRRPGERVRVSVDGGGQPKWRNDGKELFFRPLGGPLMAVEVKDERERLEVGRPTELFDVGVTATATGTDYAVSSDGQRFLVKVPADEGSRTRIHVVTNWTSLLE
jgi:Tol biopolymer transport system component